MADTDDRSLEPTLRGPAHARAEGRVPRSFGFASAGLLVGGLVVLVISAGAVVDFLSGLLSQSLSRNGWRELLAAGDADGQAALEVAGDQFQSLVVSLAKVLLP